MICTKCGYDYTSAQAKFIKGELVCPSCLGESSGDFCESSSNDSLSSAQEATRSKASFSLPADTILKVELQQPVMTGFKLAFGFFLFSLIPLVLYFLIIASSIGNTSLGY